MVAHENFFLHDNENIITETYVSELNENIPIYGLVAFLGKTNNKDNWSDNAQTQRKIQSEKRRL